MDAIALSAVCVLLAAPAATAEVWDAPAFTVSAASLRVAADALPQPTGTPAVEILFEEAHVKYEEDGRESFVYRRVLLMRSEAAAAAYRQIEASWSPWHQKRPEIRARVISAKGEESRLDAATLAEVSLPTDDPDVFTDNRALTGPLPTMTRGSILEEEIVHADSSPYFAAGTSQRFFFGATVPVHRSRLVLDAPEGLSLQYQTRGLRLKPKKQKSGTRVVVTYDTGLLAPRETQEPDAPTDVVWPHVAWSTGASWKSVATGYAGIVEKRIEGSKASPPDVAGRSRLEAISAVLATVHAKVRYTGIEFGDAAIIPATPDEVLSRGFGDCKDKAVLLIAMLRKAGVDAKLALLNVGPGIDTDEDLPGLSFDHAIVFLPGSPDLWIDATNTTARAGDLPMRDRDRFALVIDPSTKRLVRTPGRSAAENRIVITRAVTLPERGRGSIVETTEYSGSAERTLRRSWLSMTPGELREGFEEDAKDRFKAKSARVTLPDAADLGKPLRVSVESHAVGRALTMPGDSAVAMDFGAAFDFLPESVFPSDGDVPEPRKSPWVPYEPFEAVIRHEVTLPPGFDARELPASGSRRFGDASISTEAVRESGRLLYTFRFSTGVKEMKPADVEALRAEVRRRRENVEMLVMEQTGQQKLAAGKVPEALAEFRALAKAHPEEALHHSQIARALLVGGFGDAARDEARRAVKLDPKDAYAHATLGLTLQHDRFGRPFHAGMDLDGAVAAFRNAVKLEPDDVDTRASLAMTLEHDERGRRYADPSRLDEAIREYKRLHESKGGSAYSTHLLFALFRRGRFTDVRELASKPTAGPARDGFLLAAIAAERGADAAADESRRSADRAAALVAGADILVSARRYSEASALVAAAASLGGRDSVQLQARSALLARVRPQDTKDATGDPASLVRRAFFLFVRPETSNAEVLSLFAKRVQQSDEERTNLDVERSKVSRYLGRTLNLEPVVLADITVSLVDLSTIGTDKEGWRVTSRMSSQKGNIESPWFVSREGKRLVLVPAEAEWLADEASQQLSSKRVGAARQWLDWAVELLGSPPANAAEGYPLQHLWTKGSEAPEAEIRIALAAALARRNPKESVPVLEKAIRSATGARKTALLRALAGAYIAQKRFADVERVAAQLEVDTSSARTGRSLRLTSLALQKRSDEMLEILEAAARKEPKDDATQADFADSLAFSGDNTRAQAIRRNLIQKGSAGAGVLNNAAWTALFDSPTPEAVEWAERANAMTGYGAPHILHTLATLYAETGRPTQAREVLLQSIDMRESNDLASHDWYVIGRIAEDYGLTDVARDAYSRVRPSEEKEDRHNSAWELARRRLDLLPKTN